jgi:hypothetical protein
VRLSKKLVKEAEPTITLLGCSASLPPIEPAQGSSRLERQCISAISDTPALLTRKTAGNADTPHYLLLLLFPGRANISGPKAIREAFRRGCAYNHTLTSLTNAEFTVLYTKLYKKRHITCFVYRLYAFSV